VLGQLLRFEAVARQQRRRRLSATEGRHRLLDAGRQLAYDNPAGEPLANIRLKAVADVAGVTIGAFYHYWETQDDYRLDLLRHLLEPERFDTWTQTAGAIEPLVDEGAALVEVIRLASREGFAALCDRPDQRVSMALWAQDEAESIRLLRSMYGAVTDAWADLYVSVLAHYGREPRPPFDGELIAMVMTALTDGLLVRHSLEPARLEADLGGSDGEEWSLVSVVVLALLPTMTRPVTDDPSEQLDLWAAVDRLLAE
jgi:AcrR family transcriptional regulator